MKEHSHTDNIIQVALFSKRKNWNNSSRVELEARPTTRDLKNNNKKLMWIKYYYCKKKGDITSEYRKLKINIGAGEVKKRNRKRKKKSSIEHTAKIALGENKNKETIVYLFMIYTNTRILRDYSKMWIIDSSTTRLITSQKEWFIYYTNFDNPIPVSLENNSIINTIESGSIQITMHIKG